MNTIAFISTLFTIVPLICGLSVFKKLKQEDLSLFFIFVLCNWLSESITSYLVYRKIYTHLWGNIYLLFECLILISVLSYWIYTRLKLQIRLMMFFYAVIWLSSMLILKSTMINNYSITLERFILMCLSGYFLLKFMAQSEDQNPFRSPQFWMASGVFIYFTSTIIIYSMASIFMTGKMKLITNYCSIFNSIMNIVGYILYSIGFLTLLPKRKLSFINS